MTDSLKFGPEWLRNMSSDNSGSNVGSSGGSGSNSIGSGTSTSLATSFVLPRFQQAEYRYGREEMLSLCEKDMKLPEILPNFKKLYVEKEQLPLALSPSTEDEGVYQFPQRAWPLRSAISLAPPPRLGRGGSVDRGRGRPRMCTSISFPARPPFDENLRVAGRGADRSWPERNGGNDIGGSGDWNGSPSSSPRKEYSAHGRTAGMENWRRNRVEDESGDGWRSSNHSSGGGGSYRWSRSTSWREEEPSNPFINNSSGGAGGLNSGGMVPITRSLSSSASMGHSSSGGGGSIDRISSHTSNGSVYKALPTASNSHELDNAGSESGPRIRNDKSSNVGNENSISQSSKANMIWDQEDIPEWAMENTADGGGSFDASGAFHVPDDEDDSDGEEEEVQSSEHTIDSSRRSTNGQKNLPLKNRSDKMRESKKNVSSGLANDTEEHALNVSSNVRNMSGVQTSSTPNEPKIPQSQMESSHPIIKTEPALLTGEHTHKDLGQLPQKEAPHIVTMASNNVGILMQAILQPTADQITPKNHSSDIADRMQEVADDMVEKLIMEDEITATSTAGNASSQVSLMKSTVTSSSPTGVANPLLQRPIQVHSHPIVVPPPQPPPTSSNDMWYYRDPQNKIQGPFTGTEMAEWYRSDYFDENLFVRRVCDSRFATLGELVKMCGNSMPFLSSHLIPPLQMTPVMPLGNQTSTVVPPGPPPINIPQSKSISIVNPLLNTNDMAASLNLQLQYLQKEYLIRQQNLILSKLSASEQFAILSPERQQQIIQQQMTQVSLPDNIVNLPAFINFLHGGVTPSAFSMQQIIPANNNNGSVTKADLNQIKITPHNAFVGGGGPPELPVIPTIHNIMQNANTAPPMPPPPHTLHQNISVNADDPMKAFLRHIQQAKTMPQTVGNVYPQNVVPSLQQMPWLSASNPTTIGVGPVGMWDFDPMVNKIHAGMKPEMKTEQQILEEQRQQQQQQQLQMQAETKLPIDTLQCSNSDATPVVKQSILIPNQVKTQLLQPNEQHQLLQQREQQPRGSKKSEEKSKASSEDALKPSKADESKKLSKSVKLDRKEPTKLQKPIDEDRKREVAEERKKQKEEKKKQLVEEEKKRQQHLQEEEKRRQMLEEKKRQEEIDRHRRAKMLENAPAKTQKASPESSRSSLAPWSNPSVPTGANQAASLAEIQKAERERRTEERLELMNQRKIQQIEMLSKIEPTLTWNAPPISVKSLAEIQAEEHKNQQQVVYEHNVTTVVPRRKKDDVLVAQPSIYVVPGPNVVSTSAPAQAASIASIWSSWNGKSAWTSTSNAGFWEEPAKIPSNTGSAASANNSKQTSSSSASTGSSGGNRLLSKSQTFSSIQSSYKNNQNSTGTGGSGGDSKSISNAKSIKAAPIKTGKSSSVNLSGGQNSSNKKDDARNEFTSWCIKALSVMKSSVDVPTFIQFLQDIESPYEVKDYIRIYLGETKDCTEFAKQFLERRSKYKNQQRAQNAHIDDMCSPAPAINPSSNDFQEVKGKSKKVKKSKMTRLDARILGFSVTAAQDRINVGDRDYGDTA